MYHDRANPDDDFRGYPVWLLRIELAVGTIGALLLICLALGLFGCKNHTREIADQASNASQISKEGEQAALRILDETTKPSPDIGLIAVDAGTCIDNFRDIHKAATTIQAQIPHVEDKVPWWATMLGRGFIAVALIAVAFLLWQTGLGSLIKRIVWGIGMFIPKATKNEVAIDMDMYEESGGPTTKEAASITYKRAKYPDYDAAWKKEKAARERVR